MSRPNCYDCIHRRDLPGSAHSSCAHPETAPTRADGFAQLAGFLGKRSGVTAIRSAAESKLNIQADRHGIVKGWFLWPMNFDPVWLENCNGFEKKSTEAQSGAGS